ncbi:hypothetical protein TWF970_004231 [Orbilia oligospora]|uniref:Uncharacterized protein n=1 Tax=Orbilia oligospora TaxID=2813651 RepID=A0A7C8VMZ5_ORBOL|nr:hypothetical protein TWF970_004231 [Orbilia oligospora]
MKPAIISTAALCLLLSTLPSFVLGSFEMAFDNYLYGEGRAPQYRAYDDQSCNRIPPITSDPRIVMSIAMRSTPEGLDTGYNTRPPPAIAFYFDPNPTAPGPQHCLDSQLVMVAKYYDEGSYPWRTWDENVGYENGDIGRIGTVIWATGEGWRRTDVMVRDVGYDWQPVIRAGQDWITSEDPDSESLGEGEGNVARVGDIFNDDDEESSDSDTLALRRLPPRQPYNPAVEEEEEEDSVGFSPPRGLRAPRQRANDEENMGYNPSMEDHDGYAGVDFEFPEEEAAFQNYTEPDEVARQEMYHTRRILQLADLQRDQQRMAMMAPVTFNGRLMQGRNDAIVAGNYTAIPESQRHRSYGDLVSNGWYIDPEQELRARWQEYMRIAFLRFKERHGIAAGATAEQLTQRERDLFVDFLRRDGTPMFFQDSYMRPIINSHTQQQLINSFGPPPVLALPDQPAANLQPNPFLGIEEDLEDAIQNGGERVAAQRERERVAQNRHNRRMEQLRLQNENANNRARQITMVRDPNWANQRRRQRQRRRRPLRRDDLGFLIDSDAEGFENWAGARSRIMRNQPGARRVNRNLQPEIDAWDDLVVEADDEYEAGWNIPDLEPPLPIPQPVVEGNWGVLQPPGFNFGGFIPPELLGRPPSPSTEPGDNPGNMAEEEEEVIDPDAPLPQFQRFNSEPSSSQE